MGARAPGAVGARLLGPLSGLGALLVVYLAIPVVAFVLRLARSPDRGFGVQGLWSALWVSLIAATISLVLIAVLGIPLAYVLARSRGRLAAVASALVRVPLALPPVMAGILLVYLVGPYTWLGRLSGGRLTESMAGIVIAMTFCAAPFLVVTAQAGFAAVDPGLLDVAACLGHGETSRFLRVAVPTAAPSVRSGLLLAWLRAFGEYGAVVVLAYNPASLPVYTYKQFAGTGLPTTMAPTALAMLAAVVVVSLSRAAWRRPARDVLGRDELVAPLVAANPATFDVQLALGGFSLVASRHEPSARLAILGPSGSGKSALLRCIAGLHGNGVGVVHYGSRDVTAERVERRRVGYVAQNFSLFPTMNVARQLSFPVRSTPGAAAHWARRLGIEPLLGRLPSELSGGQRQRVALAQALCSGPDLLLLDEPLSSLDAPVRRELRRDLRRLQRETGIATVIVTHDPEEAAALADDVMVLTNGSVLQQGETRRVYSEPTSLEVARLVGLHNVAEGVLHDGALSLRGVDATLEVTDAPADGEVLWRLRSGAASLERLDAGAHDHEATALPARVVDVEQLGLGCRYVVSVGTTLEVELRVEEPLELDVGDECVLLLQAGALRAWPGPSS